jgi:hypothetical protein
MVSRAVRLGTLLCAVAASDATVFAADDNHLNPYAGQQHRPIKALSAADVEALENGQGWGLAKPAELNGYPGPLHVLELADELQLTEEQVTQVTTWTRRLQVMPHHLS